MLDRKAHLTDWQVAVIRDIYHADLTNDHPEAKAKAWTRLRRAVALLSERTVDSSAKVR